jgi:hypothetical protein
MALGPLALQSQLAATNPNLQKRRVSLYTQRTLRGAEVVDRVTSLRKKNKGLARALRDLEKQHLRPAIDQGISLLHEKNQAAAGTPSNQYLKASFKPQSFSNQGYEMTFIPYDDGFAGTWEGAIYEHDPDGLEYVYTTTINIAGDPEAWDTVVETYYPIDGSPPVSSNDPQYRDPSYHPYDPIMELPVARSMSTGKTMSPSEVSFHHTSQGGLRPLGYPVPPHWQDRIKRWVKCSAAGCVTSAIGCIWSGPGWAGCFGGWCAGSGAGCVILAW